MRRIAAVATGAALCVTIGIAVPGYANSSTTSHVTIEAVSNPHPQFISGGDVLVSHGLRAVNRRSKWTDTSGTSPRSLSRPGLARDSPSSPASGTAVTWWNSVRAGMARGSPTSSW